MEGKNVEVFLQTPLFRFKYIYEGEEKQLLEGAVRISGKIAKEKPEGFIIRVDAVSNLKVSETKLPFKDIFIPFSKVDYIVVQ